MNISQVSVNVGGTLRNIDVTEQDGKKSVSESALKAAIPEITDDQQLQKAYEELFKKGVTVKLDCGTEVSSLPELDSCTNHLQNISADDFVGDMSSILKLFFKCNQSMRTAAREVRHAELDAQVSALNASASEMKTAAQFRFAAGLTQGICGVVSGSVQIGAGVTQMAMGASAFKASKGSIEAGKLSQEYADKAANLSKSDSRTLLKPAYEGAAQNYADQSTLLGASATKTTSNAQALGGAIGTGGSTIISSGGSAVAAGLNYAAELHDIKSKERETEAKTHETNVQHANELMENTQEIMRDIREKLGAMQQAQIETNRGIARNI